MARYERVCFAHRLAPDPSARHDLDVGVGYDEQTTPIDYVSFLQAIFAIHLAATLGYLVHGFLEQAGLKLPLFVPALLSGILLSNTIPHLMPKAQWPSRTLSVFFPPAG